MLRLIAAVAPATTLAACGGGSSDADSDTGAPETVPVQPDCQAHPELCR